MVAVKNIKIVVKKENNNTSSQILAWFYSVLLSSLVFAFHLFIAPYFDLTVDESHYALYGKFLSLSYFDHPPLVGWLQFIALQFDNSEFALRIIPSILFFLTSLSIHSLTRQLYSKHSPYSAFIAVVLLNSIGFIQVISIAMLPELPLVLSGIWVVKFTHHAIKKQNLFSWIILGIFLGLAGLSKYSAILFVPPIILLLIFTNNIKQLITIKPYICALIAIIFISPVLIWNYQNDWVSFAYQLERTTAIDNSWSIINFLKAQVMQIILFTPLIYLGFFLSFFWALKNKKNILVVLWTLSFLIFFSFLSGLKEPLFHWLNFAWIICIPLIAVYIPHLWQKTIGRFLIYISSFLSGSFIIIFYLFLFDYIPPIHNIALKDITGWKNAANKAKLLLEDKKNHNQKSALFVENWSYGSRIAWYAYPTPVQTLDNKNAQFNIWYKKDKNYTSGILITLSPLKNNPSYFSRCKILNNESLQAKSPKQKEIVNIFYFYWCNSKKLDTIKKNNP